VTHPQNVYIMTIKRLPMPPDVRLGSDCTTELDCVGTVKTPSTVIPALHRCVTQGSLGDRNALPLTAADTTNKVITNSSIPRVGYTKHCHRNITEMADIFLARSSVGGVCRCNECVSRSACRDLW
jgi:hypothetical protein